MVKVVDSTGTVIEYVYDEVGNILEIKRTAVAGLAIFNFTPQQGPVTTQVTIQGQGFSATPLDNTVRFNGVTAEVTAATPATLVTRVPLGTTTGPISVSVSGETATSSQHFTVTDAPVITSITPKTTLTGTTLPNVMITRLNLTGSTFTFLPVFIPPVITINAATIDPSGTAATLHVTIGNQASQFVLVATNGEGSSDSAVTAGNTLGVLSPQQLNDDTDGDGFQDGLEFILGSDPFDPSSVPPLEAFRPTEAVGVTYSTRNIVAPPADESPRETVGLPFSTVNITAPPAGVATGEAVGSTFTVVNEVNPGPAIATSEAVSATFSAENQASP